MKKFVTLLILATTMLLALSACNGNTEVQEESLQTDATPPAITQQTEQPPIELETESGTRHYFHNLGFSVVLPAFWEGKYGLIEFEAERDYGIIHFVEIYHIATRQEMLEESGFAYGGRIMSLGMSPHEGYTYDYPPVMAGGTMFLAQTGGRTYFVNFPSGVEHSENPDSTAATEYLEMVGHWEPSHWDFLINSFRLIED